MNDIKQLISKRVQSLHPNSLIRDLVIEDVGDDTLRVNYLKVKKDDTHLRCTLTVVVARGV